MLTDFCDRTLISFELLPDFLPLGHALLEIRLYLLQGRYQFGEQIHVSRLTGTTDTRAEVCLALFEIGDLRLQLHVPLLSLLVRLALPPGFPAILPVVGHRALPILLSRREGPSLPPFAVLGPVAIEGRQIAILDNPDPRRQRLDQITIVTDQQDGACEVGQHILEDLLRSDVEMVRRFIKHQYVDFLQRQAYQLLLDGGVSKALDLSLEDPKTVSLYDTSQYVRNHNWRSVSRGRSGYYTSQAKTLGKLLLLARRLCEAGCGFVTVHASYAGVWDMHADGNNPGMVKGMNMLGSTLDKSLSAFMDDLTERGLSEKVLLVVTGDFGRTPTINKRGGRDHWAKLGTLAFAGGGLPIGQVIGKADRRNGEPADNPISPNMMMGTILHTLFDFGKMRIAQSITPELIQRVENAHPIPELVV